MATATQVGKERQSTRKTNGRKLGPERWDEWTEHLERRQMPATLIDLLPGSPGLPLLWAVPGSVKTSESAELISRLQRLKPGSRAAVKRIASELESWIEGLDIRRPDVAMALEALAWTHALPILSQVLPAAPWCELLDQLTSIANESAAIDLREDPLTQQLLAGELSLTLAYLLPELADCKSLASAARDSLSQGLVELLDGEGTPRGSQIEMLRPLLACWTRCGYLGQTMKPYAFTSSARLQYEWLVLQAMRLCRHDGTQVLSHDVASEWTPALFESALALGGDRDDHEIGELALPSRKGSRKTTSKLPSPAMHSEWSSSALLRRDWNRQSDRLAVSYGDSQVAVELCAGNQVVFSGPCNPELQIDGDGLAFEQDWDEVCWLSDDDLDYIEIQINLDHGVKVQRQILLAREERFLFMADAILATEIADISYRNVLPLASGVNFRAEDESRDGMLVGRKRIGAVLPLQLPEWRSDREGGALEQVDEGLQLRQSCQGQCMLAPLFIDLDPKRVGRPLTWRRLTVARQLETVQADVAVGYRVQAANQQWLIYRSLGPILNTSLLGQNFCSEFVVGRFTEQGEIENLIEIE